MQSRHLSIYARITLLAAVAGVMTACTSTTYYHDSDPYYEDSDRYYHDSDRYYSPGSVHYDYWYYPEIGAYYNPRTRIYIYYEHDHWIRARALPPV